MTEDPPHNRFLSVPYIFADQSVVNMSAFRHRSPGSGLPSP